MKQLRFMTAVVAASCALCQTALARDGAALKPKQSGQNGENQGRRPDWISKYGLEHKTETPAGTLELKRRIDIDGQAGVTFFAVPGLVVPRIDITARTAMFLTPPGGQSFLMGFLPRIRVSLLFPTTYRAVGTQQEFSGLSVALGGCYTPYFKSTGFALLLCADYGGGIYELEHPVPVQPDGTDDALSVPAEAVVKVSASIEAEYNIASFLHVPIRVGYEGNLVGTYEYLDDEGQVSHRRGRATLFMTAGLGLHF